MALSMRKKAAGIVLVGASTLALVGAGVGAVLRRRCRHVQRPDPHHGPADRRLGQRCPRSDGHDRK